MNYTINEERLTAEEYIGFLKQTDLGSQYPKERFNERIERLVKNASISLVARDEENKIELKNDILYMFNEIIRMCTLLMNKDNTVRRAGGFIIQLMPFAEDEVIDKLEQKIGEIKSITELLDQEMTPEMILEHVLGDFGLEINETLPTKYECNCSKERVQKAIISIGKKDIQEMIDDGEPIEVNCHFCDKHYQFTVDDLKEMINYSQDR